MACQTPSDCYFIKIAVKNKYLTQSAPGDLRYGDLEYGALGEKT